MKKRHAIAYAYPTSSNAETLGFSKTGCYYIEETILREDGTWSPPYIAQGCEGFATKEDADLKRLLSEYKAD